MRGARRRSAATPGCRMRSRLRHSRARRRRARRTGRCRAACDVDRAPDPAADQERRAQLVRDAGRLEQIAVARAAGGMPARRVVENAHGDPARREVGERVVVLDQVLAADEQPPRGRGALRVKIPRSISSCGASLVISRVCGSSVCRSSHRCRRRAAAAGPARRSTRRGAAPGLPSSTISCWSRSTDHRGAGMTGSIHRREP